VVFLQTCLDGYRFPNHCRQFQLKVALRELIGLCCFAFYKDGMMCVGWTATIQLCMLLAVNNHNQGRS
jgi:hypothetical protein